MLHKGFEVREKKKTKGYLSKFMNIIIFLDNLSSPVLKIVL